VATRGIGSRRGGLDAPGVLRMLNVVHLGLLELFSSKGKGEGRGVFEEAVGVSKCR
jgi:hypothetical protein